MQKAEVFRAAPDNSTERDCGDWQQLGPGAHPALASPRTAATRGRLGESTSRATQGICPEPLSCLQLALAQVSSEPNAISAQ